MARVTISSNNLFPGPKGQKGDTGDTGATGATGATGPGVVTGGTAGQALTKINSTDYNTQWTTIPLLDTANTFTTSPQQINAASSQAGLIIRANATTPDAFLNMTDSVGNILSFFNAQGSLRIGSAVVGTALGVSTATAGAAAIGLIVRGTTSQSGDLTQWQNSAAAVLARVASNGIIYAPSFGAGSGGAVSTDNLVDRAYSGSYLSLTSTNATMLTRAATNIGLIIKGAASQTADLQQWQNSAGTVLTRVGSDGRVLINGGSGFYTSAPTLGVITLGASTPGLIVRGAASQTANLQEWQNSTGTTMAYVDSNGNISGNYVQVGLNSGIVSGGSYFIRVNYSAGSINIGTAQVSGTQFQVTNATAANVAQIIKGAASQTAALQQWQTSAGTVVAQMTSTGALQATNLASLNNWVFTKEESGGGQIRLKKMTAAAAANRATDFAQLYFRDGTNAGTLKLVVIAGTTGTETTILDNISQ